MLRHLVFFLTALILFSSCEKKEEALVLPPPTGASHATVDIGATYDKQVYFDFETGSAVYTGKVDAWDLAFDASADGREVYLNGGNSVVVYNTHSKQMNEVQNVPASVTSTDWLSDAPEGHPGTSAIGEWFESDGSSKGEVYLLRSAAGEYRKLRMLSVDARGYTIEWASLDNPAPPVQVQLNKDSLYNFVHFSFESGKLQAEPPKATWDILFTYYRDMVYHTELKKDVPYPVAGVLLNPYRTSVSADSTTAFSDISLQKAVSVPVTTDRNIIGYDWKVYNFSTGKYTVNRAKNYVVHTRKEQIYKLRFLDYYNSSGVRGNPLFEFVRLR